MDFSSAKKEYERLKKLIAHHDYQYHTLDSPEISDPEFDALVVRLNALLQKYPALAEIATQKPGSSPLPQFKKIRHVVPMLSLENAFSQGEVEGFLQRINRFLNKSSETQHSCVAEPKIDGLSACLIYQDGILTLAGTRGNGTEGEDITLNVKTIDDIPQVLETPIPGKFEVRGEIYMTLSDFAMLNEIRAEKGETLFANPRNAAAGSIRQLDVNITKSRKLHFFAYQAIMTDKKIKTHFEILSFLKEEGFSVNPHIRLCTNTDEIMEFYHKMQESRYTLDYEIDGCVYKINNLDLQERLGFVGRAPRFAIAHKFTALNAASKIEGVQYQVGRTGTITPVALLRPTLVGGAVISRSTLHNFDEIKRKDIRLGDHVLVERAGDVIPKVIQVLYEKRSEATSIIVPPKNCPVCHTPLVREKVQLYCPNHFGCRAQIIERLVHFVSKNALNIVGLGRRHIELFYEWGLVQNPEDFFTLEAREPNSLTPLRTREGWGLQSVRNLFRSIADARTVDLSRFIYALGILQVGQTTADLLAKHFITGERFVEAMFNISPSLREELLHLDGLGEGIANDLTLFFDQDPNKRMIRNLLGHLNILPVERPDIHKESKLFGKIIIFTGTLSISRIEAKELSQRAGAKVVGSISSKTDYLIAGKEAGSKLKKAKALGVSILNEDEWRELL